MHIQYQQPRSSNHYCAQQLCYYVSFVGLLLQQLLCFLPLKFGHLGEIQNPETGDTGDDLYPVVGHFGDNIIDQHEPLQFFAGPQFGHLLDIADFVVHQKYVLQVRQSLAEVAQLLDAVVGEDEGGEPVEVGKIAQFPDFIIAQVNALEEVLRQGVSYQCGAHVLDCCDLVAPQVQLPLVEGVGELRGLLDQFCCYLHSIINSSTAQCAGGIKQQLISMAKKSTMLFRLLSSAGTGYFYVGKKNVRDTLKKLSVIKYDPMVNQHVIFNEVKMPSGKKRT